MNSVYAWQKACDHLLKVEGGLVNNPKDPGGITKYGISLRFLKDLNLDADHDGDVDADDIRALSPAAAAGIYYDQFWNRYGYATLPEALAIKVFDMSVNMGPAQAHRLLQRSMIACGAAVDADGKLGPKSWAELDKLIEAGEGELLYTILKKLQAQFYNDLVSKKPALSVFLRGWMNRVDSC
jgi:lysozyme family protein